MVRTWLPRNPQLLNHHLTSDSSVDSSRDPVSYKAQRGEMVRTDDKRMKNIFKGRILMPAHQSPAGLGGGNLQVQYKLGFHMV